MHLSIPSRHRKLRLNLPPRSHSYLRPWTLMHRSIAEEPIQHYKARHSITCLSPPPFDDPIARQLLPLLDRYESVCTARQSSIAPYGRLHSQIAADDSTIEHVDMHTHESCSLPEVMLMLPTGHLHARHAVNAHKPNEPILSRVCEDIRSF